MTTDELNTIVAAVVAELEKSGVDFDYKAQAPEDSDLVFVIRGTAPDYQGVTVTWKGLLDIITAQATQAKTDAVNAKDIAQQILTQVQSKGTEITNFVATSKTEIETQKNESVNAVKSVYQTDLDELKGDLDTERNARIEADTDHSTRIQKVEVASSVNRYEIDNLKAKAEGKLYRTETVEAEAYTVDVPSSVAPYAEVQKIGGKSVVWNQLFEIITSQYASNSYINDCSALTDGNYLKITSNTNSKWNINFYTKRFYTDATHNYFLTIIAKADSDCSLSFGFNSETKRYNLTNKESLCSHIVNGRGTNVYIYISGDINSTFYVRDIKVIDLTLMFGAGNEPTLEECKKIFSEDYYPYDAGTIKSFPVKRVKSLKADGTEIGSIDVSSFTADLKSAGSVHDEWSNGKVTKKIGVVDLGTLDWNYNSTYSIFFAYPTAIIIGVHNLKPNLICSKYETVACSGFGGFDSKDKIASIISATNAFMVKDTTYTNITEFKSAMSGVMLYYELATPTESEVPEIDNFIQVEGGGTLTFESDETIHMPVPSTNRFVVDLT